MRCTFHSALYFIFSFVFIFRRRTIFLGLIYLFAVTDINAQEAISVFVEERDQSFVLKDTAALGAYYDLLNQEFGNKDIHLVVEQADYYYKKGVQASVQLKKHAFTLLFAFNTSDLEIRREVYGDTAVLFNSLKEIKNPDSRFGKDNNFIRGTNIQVGDYYFYVKQNCERALHHYFNAAELRSNSIEIFDRIGKVYEYLGDVETAIKYARMGIDSKQYNLVFEDKIYRLSKMAKMFKVQGNKDSMVYYMELLIDATQEIDGLMTGIYNSDLLKISANSANLDLALLYLELGDIPKADRFFNKVERSSSLSLIHYDFVALKIAMANNDFEKAEKLMHTIKYNSPAKKDEIFGDFYEKTKDYEKALFYQKRFYESELNNSSVNQQQYAAFANAKYEKSKIEEKIRSLETEQEQQKMRNLFGIVLFILLGLFAIGLMYLLRQNKIRRTLLERDLQNKNIIEEQSKELQKTDALKSRLFTNISHELRTPLTLISGPIEHLLAHHPVDKKTQSVLAMAQENSQKLLTMVNEISDLSKAEVSSLNIQPKSFNLKELLDFLAEKFRFLAKIKNIDLKIITEDADMSLLTDPNKLETIIQNLISNALKYSIAGDQIELTVQNFDENIELKVKDTGRGIAINDLEKVFDRYYQATEGEIIPEGGMGIGLAICKEYANIIGGSIGVVSELNIGTVFTLSFPKQVFGVNLDTVKSVAYNTQQISSPENFPNTPFEENSYLLIVEDNLDLCTYLSDILSVDYDLVFVHNGKEALKNIEKRTPDLIITDLMMPIMGGMEMIQIIGESDKFSEVPILVLTAKNNILDELKAMRIGVCDYLVKPFQEKELKTIIYNLIYFAEIREKNYLTDIELATSSIVASPNQKTNRLAEIEEKIIPIINDFTLNIDALAETLNMSTTHLNREMKKLTGMTPKRYINEVRLLTGRRMLENKEENSVKAVAYSVGYKSEKVFSRSFIHRFGKYPSEYLK